MTPERRWRLAILVVGVLSLGLAVAGSQAAARLASRALAERSARSVAEYLRLVTRAATPPARGFDLPDLLIRVRGLEALGLETPDIEVYAATAPLAEATAEPLAPSSLATLREGSTVIWDRGAALAPLRAGDDSVVVGAVAVRPPSVEPLWAAGLALPALLAVLPVAFACARRIRDPDAMRAFERYLLMATLFGGAVYFDARFASYDARKRWTADTSTLVEEAARTRGRAVITDLASVATDGALLSPDSAGRLRGARDATTVRLMPGRNALRRAPRDAVRPWSLALLALALLGPGVARLGIARVTPVESETRGTTVGRRRRPPPTRARRDPTRAS